MKRKIAILLASTMALSTVPAFAAKTNAPALVGSVQTVSSGNKIDASAFSVSLVTSLNALKSRVGVLKIDVAQDGSADITNKTSFEVTLENGEFDTDTPSLYYYRNIVVDASGNTNYISVEPLNGVYKLVVRRGSWNTDPIKVYDATELSLNTLNRILSGTETFGSTFTGTVPFDGEKFSYFTSDGISTLILKGYDANGNDLEVVITGPVDSFEVNGETMTVVDEGVEYRVGKEEGTLGVDSSFENGILTFIDEDGEILSTAEFKYEKSVESDAKTAGLPHIPYVIEVTGSKTATVTFFVKEITDVDIAEGGDIKVSSTQLYLALPLGGVEVTGDEVKATVRSFGNNITSGTVTIAKAAAGATYIDSSYTETQLFEDGLAGQSFVVFESAAGTIEAGAEGTLRLSSGFEFSGNGTIVNKVTGEVVGTITTNLDNTNRATFKINENYVPTNTAAAFEFRLPNVYVTDESKYGDVSVTISGGGFSTGSIVIGTRSDMGYTVKTVTDIPTITKGRHEYANTNIESGSNYTAEIEIAETIAGSLYANKNLDFNLPEGVKVVDVDVVSVSGGGKLTTSNESDVFTITNDGSTLRLKKDSELYNANTETKIRLKLSLSIDAGFTGEEVKLNVTGAGYSNTGEIVVAKVQAPVSVTTQSKDINLGYQNYSASDIVITENAAGMLIEGENLELSINAPYGSSELGFSGFNVEVLSGDIELGKASISSGNQSSIVIPIKGQSIDEPATIKLSNVTIGTTRAVPFGAYTLEVAGGAVLNNNTIDDNGNTLYTESMKEALSKASPIFTVTDTDATKGLAKRIDAESESISVGTYVNLVTVTDTIDTEMQVTIGSTTAVIDGKEIVMDVAPYISADGNTMVPLRFVAVALAGGDAAAADESSLISWDNVNKVVTIYYGSGTNTKLIQFQVGSSYMTVDGTKIAMDNNAAAEIKDGRTFVPFRALGNALGVSVNWDAETKTAIYNQK